MLSSCATVPTATHGGFSGTAVDRGESLHVQIRYMTVPLLAGDVFDQAELGGGDAVAWCVALKSPERAAECFVRVRGFPAAFLHLKPE